MFTPSITNCYQWDTQLQAKFNTGGVPLIQWTEIRQSWQIWEQ